MRVAVVGAGVAGSACTWRLLASKGCHVTLLEMGRGAGGRAGTRHVHEVPGLPDLHVNHGAPLFHIPAADQRTKPLISALLASGHVAEWHGTCGGINAVTGALSAGEGSRGELEVGDKLFSRYTGTPGMSALAGGCLELARRANPAALDVRFGIRVKEFRPKKVSGSIVSWEIFDKDGRSHGEFDWVVVSGATPALARWRAGFKEEPPVLEAAQVSGSARMQSLVAALDPPDKPLAYEQTHVALLAWDVSRGDAARILRGQLPFDITHVSEDAALAKVSLQSLGPPYAVVALHSTGDFARRHKAVMGSGSYVSVANKVEGSVTDEAARFAFAGDFLAPPVACVAAALRSGLATGESLLRHVGQGLPSSEL
ncbi:unnamed protein product [Polarella glacialis]|uniref:Amine oxidase n=1 Tax=Polarella glacialis TaxID=89957 RepID=A0A813LPH2_POLGL|nr:unnamed protein product [Polarella glacialis]